MIEIAAGHPGVFAAVGVQPNHVAEAQEQDWSTIVELARHGRIAAIGETGLDRYWDHTPFAQQQDWFDRHLRLANDLDLPVVIHCRDCEADVIQQLKQQKKPVPWRISFLHRYVG